MYFSEEIKNKFIHFFLNKDHELVPSSSLIPADQTALLTTAGMQQFVPYLSGKVEPPYRRALSVQKCFRTTDIEGVGDASHHTFFEMLGNWSFGDYYKQESIDWALELLTKHYGIDQSFLWVTVFGGEKDIPKDEEAIKIWRSCGISEERIVLLGMDDNFWGPIGSFGPCGPCTEIFIDRGEKFKVKPCTIKECGPGCKCGRFVEIWNLVFMQYNKTAEGQYEKLLANNVDTGAGLERLTAVLTGKTSDYETDLFEEIINKIKEISGKEYNGNEKPFRVIADHIRGICFLIADGVLPSKDDRGYILRRLIRRAMFSGRSLNITHKFLAELAKVVIERFKSDYPELEHHRQDIMDIINEEEDYSIFELKGSARKESKKIFNKAAIGGSARNELKKFFNKAIGGVDPDNLPKGSIRNNIIRIPGQEIFRLYETYGIRPEVCQEIMTDWGVRFDDQTMKECEEAMKKHQEKSRAGAKSKFGGVGEWGEKVASHHTATHLLQAVLRHVLGDHVHQAGSDLTPERLRFDFTHPKRLTAEEIKKVEQLVNDKIKENLEVTMQESSFEEAVKSGAMAFFKEKYPKIVKVYSIGRDSSTSSEPPFSREICAGPHVKNTGEIKNFKIIKSETSGAGVQRIKAIVNFN